MRNIHRNQFPFLIGTQFFYSGFSLIMGLTLLGNVSASSLTRAHSIVPVIGVLGVGLGLGLVLFGFVLGYGLMKRWPWAWTATLIFHILNLLSTLDSGLTLFKTVAHYATTTPHLGLPSGFGGGLFLLILQLIISGSMVETLLRVRKEFQNQENPKKTGDFS